MTAAPAEREGTVRSLDNVALELPVAGIGNRVLAAFLDHLLLAVVIGLATVGVFVVAAAMGETGVWVIAAWVVVAFLLNFGYFAVLEIAFAGRTLGKMALDLRVVSADGGTPSAFSLVVRNLLRVVDNFVGIIFLAVDPMARRLGDRLAGTIVIHQRRMRPQLVLGRMPAGWGGREVAVVESFLERCATLEPARARRLALRILAWIERDQPELLASVDPTLDPVVRLRMGLEVESL